MSGRVRPPVVTKLLGPDQCGLCMEMLTVGAQVVEWRNESYHLRCARRIRDDFVKILGPDKSQAPS